MKILRQREEPMPQVTIQNNLTERLIWIVETDGVEINLLIVSR